MKLIKILKSLWLLLVLAVVTTYYYSQMYFWRLAARLGVGDFTSDVAHGLAVGWGKAFLAAIPGWGIDIKGLESLPPPGQPVVIVANHESGTDILAIYCLGLQFRWLSKHTMFRLPLIGGAMKMAGYVPITRGDKYSHQKALARSADILGEKTSMLFFPEGTRSTSGSPKEFKSGAFRLAQKCGVPVLPVVLHGSGRLLKKSSLCPSKATVQVKVLPMVESVEGETAQVFCERVRLMIVQAHKTLV